MFEVLLSPEARAFFGDADPPLARKIADVSHSYSRTLTAATAPFKGVDAELPAGKALPITKARLRVDDAEFTAPVGRDDKLIRFSRPLAKGDVQAQTWFYDDAGKELCGAYYLYVERK